MMVPFSVILVVIALWGSTELAFINNSSLIYTSSPNTVIPSILTYFFFNLCVYPFSNSTLPSNNTLINPRVSFHMNAFHENYILQSYTSLNNATVIYGDIGANNGIGVNFSPRVLRNKKKYKLQSGRYR